MASAMFPARAASSFLPRLSSPTLSSSFASVYTRTLALPLLPKVSLSIPAISLNLPLPSLGEIWDGLLKAVPKKKVSHSRRRHRQMAGKALKDVTSLCRCPSCGELKRNHILCPTCLGRYGDMLAKGLHKQPKKLEKVEKVQSKTTTKEMEADDEPNKE